MVSVEGYSRLPAGVRVSRLLGHLEQVGNLIESLQMQDHAVSLQVWFNDGEESIRLHRLTGELGVEVFEARLVEPADE